MCFAQEMRKYQKNNKRFDLKTLRLKIESKVDNWTHRKYMLAKFRQKLSFMAFIKNQTVLEFLLNQILKSYKKLKQAKQMQIM